MPTRRVFFACALALSGLLITSSTMFAAGLPRTVNSKHVMWGAGQVGQNTCRGRCAPAASRCCARTSLPTPRGEPRFGVDRTPSRGDPPLEARCARSTPCRKGPAGENTYVYRGIDPR